MWNSQSEKFDSSSTNSDSTLNSSPNSNLTKSSGSHEDSFNSESSLESSFGIYQKRFLDAMKRQELEKKVEKRKGKNDEATEEEVGNIRDINSKTTRMKKVIEMPKFKNLPQNFNIAKQCPPGYIPCPRNCNFYILKQHKFVHIHSTECKEFEKLVDEKRENLAELEEQLHHSKNQAWRKKVQGSKEGAFVYGYTNQSSKK